MIDLVSGYKLLQSWIIINGTLIAGGTLARANLCHFVPVWTFYLYAWLQFFSQSDFWSASRLASSESQPSNGSIRELKCLLLIYDINYTTQLLRLGMLCATCIYSRTSPRRDDWEGDEDHLKSILFDPYNVHATSNSICRKC